MDESLIPLIIICSVIASLVIIPWLLFTGMRMIRDPVPFRLPLGLSVLVLLTLLAMHAILPEGGTTGVPVLVTYYLLQLLLIVLGAMTPYYWFSGKAEPGRPWPVIFILFAVIGVVLWLWTTMGVQRMGGPYSPFFPALPLTGWLLDGIVALTGTGAIVYYSAYPLYFTLLDAGLYLEIFIIAGMFYFAERKRYLAQPV